MWFSSAEGTGLSPFDSNHLVRSVITVDGLRTPSRVDKSPQRIYETVSVKGVHDFNVHSSNDQACEKASIAFYIRATLPNNKGTKVIYNDVSEWRFS